MDDLKEEPLLSGTEVEDTRLLSLACTQDYLWSKGQIPQRQEKTLFQTGL